MSGRTAQVAAIHCPVEPYDWPFARDEAARIDAHWAGLRAKKPALFDGRVLLARDLAVDGDTLRGICFEASYKSFIGWRDLGYPGPPVVNCFAMAALLAADGAFMLGEMSASTANGGVLYFPAGTPEPADIGIDGRVDYEGSILRELAEETGLLPHEVTLDARWTIVFAPRPAVACMRIARSALDAAALQARLAAHNATNPSPELTRLVAVREPADFDAARMPDFMLIYLAEALA